MNILIVEDEMQAASRLQKIIQKLIPNCTVYGPLNSVSLAVDWFKKNSSADIVFMDIHLADGNSLQIFEQVKVTCPIIFTTAHEGYALQAFKVNSIDYILKPFSESEINAALEKLQSLQKKQPEIDYKTVLQSIAPAKYRERFVVKIGDTLKSINTGDIAYFYTEHKANFLCTNDNRRYPVDYNLDQIEQMLNPKDFFRINRQFIIGHHAISDMKAYTRARVIVALNPSTKLDTVVAVDRAQSFRNWLAGE